MRIEIHPVQRPAEADEIASRAQWLQAKFVKHVCDASDSALVSKWRSDALNDCSSPLRSLIDGNRLWKLAFEAWDRPAMGKPMRSLWTYQELAAVQFGLAINRPWHCVDARHILPFEFIQEKSLTKGVLQSNRLGLTSEKLQLWQETNSQRVVRDIPLLKGLKSPLRNIWAPTLGQRRKLMCWLFGAIPRRTEQVCRLCDSEMGQVGRRNHLATCAAEKCGIRVDLESIRLRYDAEVFDSIASVNALTLLIWEAVSDKVLDKGKWLKIHNCLDILTEEALGRVDFNI